MWLDSCVARVTGTSVRFRFRGKSGKQHEVGLRDRRLASIVRRCQELPGQELFQYVGPDGEPVDVASDDVNAYLREISGADITAKDFRTWAATVLAYRALRGMVPDPRDRVAHKQVTEAVRVTADWLGNTPAVARGSYVHPAVLDAYLDGSFRGQGRATDQPAPVEATSTAAGLPEPAEEAAVLRILRRQRRATRSQGGR